MTPNRAPISRPITAFALGLAAAVALLLAAGPGALGAGRTHPPDLSHEMDSVKPKSPPVSAADAKAQGWKPKTVFKDCPDCPEMVVLPAGIFIMGLNARSPRAKPPHRVNIKRPFAMGRFEVLWSEYEACKEAGGCKSGGDDDHGWGKKGRPVINVTYFDAQRYAQWLSKKTGKTYRLPSEAEWEYGDRGGTTTVYWWGDEAGEGHANCKDCKTMWSAWGSAPAGAFDPNPFGLYDTTANLFEWVADCWNKSHRGAPADGTARMSGDCKNRVIRGGSFYYFSKVSRASYRAKNPPAVKSYWLGFRVVRELD